MSLTDRLSCPELLNFLSRRKLNDGSVRKSCAALREAEKQCAGAKVVGTHQITAFAAVKSETRFKLLRRGCHARIKIDRETARALHADALREMHRKEVGAGVGV